MEGHLYRCPNRPPMACPAICPNRMATVSVPAAMEGHLYRCPNYQQARTHPMARNYAAMEGHLYRCPNWTTSLASVAGAAMEGHLYRCPNPGRRRVLRRAWGTGSSCPNPEEFGSWTRVATAAMEGHLYRCPNCRLIQVLAAMEGSL